MVHAINFKSYEKGSMVGFFDLRVGIVLIHGCRLMSNNNGYWISLPSRQAEINGETKYLDIVEITKTEMEHVRKMVVAELTGQKHIGVTVNKEKEHIPYKQTEIGGRITPEGENLNEYYTPKNDGNDDIPF